MSPVALPTVQQAAEPAVQPTAQQSVQPAPQQVTQQATRRPADRTAGHLAAPRSSADTRAPRPWGGLRVAGAGATVPLRSGAIVPYANLDYAASAPCLEPVQDAVAAALPYYSSVHRGAGYASQVTTEAYERARETVRRFVGAWRRDTVVFTRNTTDAMNLLAHAAPAGTTVVVFESEHHATLLPWARTVRLPIPATPDEAVAAAARALRSAPEGPRLLVVTAASNVTGELWPVDRLAAVARAHGARIAVDAAQLVPHRPVDMRALDIDYIAFSGHKLYAPFGAGVLVGRSDWLRAADPYLKGGGATAYVGTDRVRWTDDPQQRHEAGTPNVLGAIALAAACEALSGTGWDTLIATEERLLARLRHGLATVPGLRTLELWGDRHPRVGIVSFVLDGLPGVPGVPAAHSDAGPDARPDAGSSANPRAGSSAGSSAGSGVRLDARSVACLLSEEHGIGVRDGRFCAHPFVERLLDGAGGEGGGAAGAGTAVRASIGVGTEETHVDRLITALTGLARR